jgi:LPXTG-motif cell wall-anchored protein
MRKLAKPAVVCSVLGLSAAVLLFSSGSASAAAPVGLGVAKSFAVLGGQTVTNTGPSVIHGDLGVSPGSTTPGVNGLPGPATVDGTQHVTDGVAANAQAALTTAYDDAAGRPTTASIGADLVGRTLTPGVYTGPALSLTGQVTLDGQNQTNPVFIFQASALVTASSSTFKLIRGATTCNVYWQIASSATLGTNSHFIGTIMALTSISAATGATIEGRLLARNGAVTLDTNTITRPNCAVTPPATSSPPAGGGTSSTPGGGKSSTPGSGGRPTNTGKPGVPLRAPGTGTSTNGSPNGPSTTPGQQPPTLARTGSDNQNLAIGGIVAIVLGGSILFIARRRLPHGSHRH